MEDTPTLMFRLDWFLRNVQQTACLQDLSIFCGEEVRVLFRKKVIVALADQDLARMAQQIFAGFVDADKFQILRVLDEDHVGKILHHGRDERLRTPQFFLHPLPFGDVAHERTVVFLAFIEEIIDTHLDADQSSILGPMDRLKHHGSALLGFCPELWPAMRLKIGIQIVDGHGA